MLGTSPAPALVLASCLQARVLAPRAAGSACCSGGEREQGAGGGGGLGLAGPRSSSSCCCKAAEVGGGGERWDEASVTLQQGLELGQGGRVGFTCSYLFMSINQRSGRQTPKG